MKDISKAIFLLLIIELIFNGCANIGTPNGGPRDTIPPVLLLSNPVNGTVDFNDKKLRLEFSEFIKADKIQQQLIITPKSENKFKAIAKRNILLLKFDELFNDSTTYNLNFADAVTDITEGNPTVNLSIAFSTGSYIDSLSISGTVFDLFSQEPVESYLVGLYPYSDTLDYFADNPLYFTTTSDSGSFQINYVKTGNYKLLVFNDENRNILLDPETEAHGFITGTIFLDSAFKLTKPIQTLLQNVKPIEFINSRSTGPYVELKYTKTISKYSVQPKSYPTSLIGENKETIRIYRNKISNSGDSIQFISSVSDSLGNITRDTIKTTFIDSNRESSGFSYNVKANGNVLSENQMFHFTFSKPITTYDTTKISFVKDSIFTFYFRPTFIWNSDKTKLSVHTNINKTQFLDSLYSSISLFNSKIDTFDTINVVKPRINPKTIELNIDNSAFISVENDSSINKSIQLPIEEGTSFGSINLSLSTDKTSFKVEIINNKGIVSYSKWNVYDHAFNKIKPGKYTIRILVDNNLDGIWSPGNLLKDISPEDIYIHPEETAVRENWLLEIDISF